MPQITPPFVRDYLSWFGKIEYDAWPLNSTAIQIQNMKKIGIPLQTPFFYIKVVFTGFTFHGPVHPALLFLVTNVYSEENL